MAAPEFTSWQICELLDGVFQSLLDLTVSADPAAAPPLNSLDLAAVVEISGDWQGAVLLSADAALARKAAARMLRIPAAQVGLADVEETLAELCNIVGGGIKGALPGQNVLALPAVYQGRDLPPWMFAAAVRAAGAFRCAGGKGDLFLVERAA